MSFRLPRVAALLFCSGACALIYQVAWFRELRLIFGASTASSAAVLAVFMGGLGLGGARLGKVADRSNNPLGLYGNLELGVAAMAAITPALVGLASTVYLSAGGSTALGMPVATALRIALSVLVLGPATFLMGGTLPAAARAVEREGDPERRRVATLYGVNTFGAVVGAVAANFILLEVFGTRLTLWIAALVNALVAVSARALSRAGSSTEGPAVEDAVPSAADGEPSVAERVGWFPPVAAALAGITFMLMELTWYRMLAPILGGSSYTFGLILAVALVGIGVGGAIYARTKVPATLRAFAATCGLEALFIAIPFALGDRVAMTAALLRPFCRVSFGASIMVWTAVAAFVVLPAAIVSGAQFPLVVGLYGKGNRAVGRDVGHAYLANTIGAITGSLAGGFGLIPILGAVGCWRLSVVALVAGAVVAMALDVRWGGRKDTRFVRGVLVLAGALACISLTGPTSVWRHSGIGAGRADLSLEPVDAISVAIFQASHSREVRWEQDGVESSVALGQRSGYAFIVNGKSDGHALNDASTQVMSGLLPALLHPAPKSTLVVGLGTGSTAGWLGAIPSMERVDVVELEPAILRVAKDCAPVNRNVLENPKVKIELADAREVLRTTRGRYDIIFSEPSNPYRAGISSMYTVEYYRAAAERLNPGGYFVQWLQAYEVDGWAIATAMVTLRQVFHGLDVWETTSGDLLLVATRERGAPLAVDRIRKRIAEEPFASAARAVWRTESFEGLVAHFVANTTLSDVLLARSMGAVNTDDQNLLEFAFARSVGHRRRVDRDLRDLAARLLIDRPLLSEPIDFDRVLEERWFTEVHEHGPMVPSAEQRPDLPIGPVINDYAHGNYPAAYAAWRRLGRAPRSFSEGTMAAELVARAGARSGPELALIELAPTPDRHVLRALSSARRGEGQAAVAALRAAFVEARTNPWTPLALMDSGLELAVEVGLKDKQHAAALHASLVEPFAVESLREHRLGAVARLAAALPNNAVCLEAVGALDPPPLDRRFLEVRVACLRAANDPRAAGAERDLLRFLELTAPFGASIPSPPPAPRAPAPTVDGGATPMVDADAAVDGGIVDGAARD